MAEGVHWVVLGVHAVDLGCSMADVEKDMVGKRRGTRRGSCPPCLSHCEYAWVVQLALDRNGCNLHAR